MPASAEDTRHGRAIIPGSDVESKHRVSLFKISGGTVYDPANGLGGVVCDLWVRDGRIIEPPSDPAIRPDRTLDAAGLVVMPGGVDMHCHIAGPKVNTARKMRPEDKRPHGGIARGERTRSGTIGSVPSTFVTGYKYAGLGYTTAFDAAIPPLAARHVHEELADTPCIDKGFYVLMGNNHYIMEAIRQGEPGRIESFVAWLLGAAKAYAPKLVNPAGVEAWKQKQAGNMTGLDDTLGHFEVSPRQIITAIAEAAARLGLPHPLHIHANNLGLPGNWSTTLQTMEALEGRRAHLTHIQFHSYGGGQGDEDTFRSQVQPLADYVNSHPNLTVDVGQVMFDSTTSMTGDGPLGYYLHRLHGGKWFSSDVELEAGCGISPIEYKNKNLVHALQWAIGLEWYLLVDDPWRVVMSTDHPNGGSFLAYPQIIKLLMDRSYRQDVLKTCPAGLRRRSILAELDREYTLSEICIITRSGPARILGLPHKGHLGAGADADITLYDPDDDIEKMFELPKYVIKSGRVIVENGELRAPVDGKLLHVAADYDRDRETEIAAWFDDHYSVSFRNYPVDDACLNEHQAVPAHR